MVGLAQRWAEAYRGVDLAVSVDVKGGGSGVGMSQLIDGRLDIANCSRVATDAEVRRAKEKGGKALREWIIAYDAVTVLVNKENPIESLSIEELRGIYGGNGAIKRWSELGVSLPEDPIICAGRQSISGTYDYFKEVVLGGLDFRQGIQEVPDTHGVVELVRKTVDAIGYGGLGYYDRDVVKALKLSRARGGPAYEPCLATVCDGSYPLARPLRMHTLGEPPEHVKRYIAWVLSAEGQRIVESSGYIPVAAVKD